MEDPKHLSSHEQSVLLSESRALPVGTEEFNAWVYRPFVEIIPVTPADPRRASQEFRIVTTRGEPGDSDYHQSPHETISFKIYDDGYYDAVQVNLNLLSPLYPKT